MNSQDIGLAHYQVEELILIIDSAVVKTILEAERLSNANLSLW